jgi:hypothetical protein
MANNENATTGETALTKYEDFKLPDMTESEFTEEELAEDMAGVRLTFPRVKIPSGGSLQFEIPGENPEDPDYAKTLDGVILYTHLSNAYWRKGKNDDDDENTPPDCSSTDGINGTGLPGGSCAVCPMNAWGTGENGRGKACKNMRSIYFLRDGDSVPALVSLAPTSLRPYDEFHRACFSSRQRGTCGSVVQIGLKRMNNGKDDYSVATFRRLYDFEGAKLNAVRQYAGEFRKQAKVMLVQQAIEAENRTLISDGENDALVDADFSDTAARLNAASELPL